MDVGSHLGSLCSAGAAARLDAVRKNVGKETKAKPARTVPAFQDSSAEKASFSIQEAAAGAFSGQPTGELSTVSAMDIMCAPNGIAAAQDGALFVTDIYNKVI